MLVVVDYGRGNLFSIEQALRQVGATPTVSDDPNILSQATRIVFPGVGSFADAMEGLQQRGLVEPLRATLHAGVPLLGICVGCQLLLETGEEFGEHGGIGVIPGRVQRIPNTDSSSTSVRIPNVGWRQVVPHTSNPVIGNISAGDSFYFVHSFAPFPQSHQHVAASTELNSTDVPVAVHKDTALGVQFHPEKSGKSGLALLERFLSWQP
jgi:imidazole glycerol-phosphate synthase subunit HisH